MKRSLIFVCFGFLLAACSPEVRPVIQYIGIAEGNMQSDINQLKFQDRFESTQHELIALIAFSEIEDGTTVQATWFSPDDRTMPLGRTSVVTDSGATIARFTLASREDWEPAPLMLQIEAFKGEEGSGLSGSGTLQFFIGMTDEEITEYMDEFSAWKKQQQEQNSALLAEETFELGLQQQAKDLLQSESVVLASRDDLLSETGLEYVYLDTEGLAPYVASDNASFQLEAEVRQLVILNASGGVLFSLLDEGNAHELTVGEQKLASLQPDAGVKVGLLTTGTWVLTWNEDDALCSQEIRKTGEGYEAGQKRC